LQLCLSGLRSAFKAKPDAKIMGEDLRKSFEDARHLALRYRHPWSLR